MTARILLDVDHYKWSDEIAIEPMTDGPNFCITFRSAFDKLAMIDISVTDLENLQLALEKLLEDIYRQKEIE